MAQQQIDILDTSRLTFAGGFNEQIEEILKYVRLAKYQVEELERLYSDLEGTLNYIWPGCRVIPFGSIMTGLGIHTSDVDCYMDLPNCYKTPYGNYVMIAKKALIRNFTLFREVFAIPKAKVPIVKFFHMPTQRYCDVSFKSPSGVRNSQLLASLMQSDQKILYLAVIIKYWTKVHLLSGTDAFPSYTHLLLLVYYLQQEGILPTVKSLQENIKPHMVDDWNTAFKRVKTVKPCESLYQLLGGFFQFYSNFDFKSYIISPFLGSCFNRELFKNVNDVPLDFKLYKQNVGVKWHKPFRLDLSLCVQDPFDHSRNCCVSVRPPVAETWQNYIAHAAKLYESEGEDTFLKALFTTRPGIYCDPGVRPNQLQRKPKKRNQNKKLKRNVGVLSWHRKSEK